MPSPLVSIVVSSFNRPRLIRDALDSCLRQTWPNLQVVVADDYSIREVQDVLDEYTRAHPDVVHVCKPDGEPPAAAERQYGGRCAKGINTAMRYVRGDFVAFLPDDDFLPKESIETRAKFLVEHRDADCVYGRLESCTSQTPVLGHHQMPDDTAEGGYYGFRHYIGGAEAFCRHDRNGFWSAEPIARAANKVDHGMMMVRRAPQLPQWPEYPTAELRLPTGRVLETLPEIAAKQGQGEVFDCPDAGWFFRLEVTGLGPFYSVPDVVIVKRYHNHGHRTDPTIRE